METNKDTEHESEKLITIPTIIPDVLLRHFTDDGLLNLCEFIDYETMPEISIAESSSETVISRKSFTKLKQYVFSKEQQEDFEDEYLEMYQNENIDIQEEMLNTKNNSDIDDTSTTENGNGTGLVQENMRLVELLPDNLDDKRQYPKYDPERRPSYEMKYGQGQVHYKLPDFSKVPPKVKIPKCDIGGVKPFPTLKRTASSPTLMGQSFAIQDILDSMQPSMQQEQKKETTLSSDHLHVQVSEDLVCTSDFNKVNSISPPASECFPPDSCQSFNYTENQTEVVLLGLHKVVKLIVIAIQQKDSEVLDVIEDALQTFKSATDIKDSQSMEIAKIPTEGEKMSRILMEQAQKLKMKTFQHLKSCLESLELNYLSAKDTHRELQLQIYRTGSQTVGEFDLERAVEGQIFRLGMLLEDVQEQINQNEESLTESASPTTPQEAHLLPYPEKTEDVTDLIINNIADKEQATQEQGRVILLPCSWSLNSTAALEAQSYLQDSPAVMEGTDISHLQQSYLSPDTCAGIKETATQSEAGLNDQNIKNSSNQLVEKDASVISKDSAPHVQNHHSSNENGQNHLSQLESSADWHLAEKSFHVEEKQITDKLKKDVEQYPLSSNRYQEKKMEKIQRKFSKPGSLSIFIQEKAMSLDIPDCNETADSLSSDWLVSSHSELSQYRHRSTRDDKLHVSKGQSYKSSENKYIHLEGYSDFTVSSILKRRSFTTSSSSSPWEKCSNGRLYTRSHSKLLNADTSMKELHKQKSFWATKIPVYAENHGSLSNKLRPNKHPKVGQHIPSSRSKMKGLVSHHPQFAVPVISTMQRKSWPRAKRNSLDYIDTKTLNSVLDQALRTAKNMQRTSERMVQQLTADLVNRPSYRSSCSF
ncbi:protein AKNAD1 [Mixophyes fleayi]|uniref:protein AKNAD1 n=1 Tax=Mixophyes fleayi TaxID=3061075 RepID=UPI003F4DE16A